MRTLFQAACSGKIVKNSLRIALMVGSILNLVNQGSAILAGTGISWIHMALNYVVPYCVASYSASKNELTPRGNQ
ncbi:nitrate/nitrite transporter NrtS [Rhodoferax sp.]|uniref:nitrate/nitrite transporter NrtS n=1 Tax=Rhodoferax sp. TaxID=50421 RepID=UPI002730397D|nr:nitrate/nitrite transporter NrtS [Rhodoferax sp.]MDP2440052.1 nitrate/nitrite transporter NrtS [Rhodoferax sp.]